MSDSGSPDTPVHPPENTPENHRLDVRSSVDWTQYDAYRCIHCDEPCVNRVGSNYARARECRDCFGIPTLDRQRPDSQTNEDEPVMAEKTGFDPEAEYPSETVEGVPVEPIEGRWSIEGAGRVDESGESLYDMHRNGVQYAEIEGAKYLDPPDLKPADRPQPKVSATVLTDHQHT